jgi:hypothetical protein
MRADMSWLSVCRVLEFALMAFRPTSRWFLTYWYYCMLDIDWNGNPHGFL